MTINTTTPSATIHYTTNGSTPTASSAVYSGPITVSATETLQPIAVASGLSNSTVGSAAYTITSAGATTTSLTASPNQVATGQTLTLTATVQGTGSTTPGGTVSFLSGSTPLGTAPVNSSGVATLTITTLAVGTYSITAQYSGNSSFLQHLGRRFGDGVQPSHDHEPDCALPNPSRPRPNSDPDRDCSRHRQRSRRRARSASCQIGSTQLGTATPQFLWRCHAG